MQYIYENSNTEKNYDNTKPTKCICAVIFLFITIMELSNEQQKLINQIAEENGFKNFTTKVTEGTNKGDNFTGVISRVTIETDQKNMAVIFKSSPKSAALRTVQPTRNMFLREMYIYEKVFKEFAAFEEEFHIADIFTARARILGQCDKENNEYLVLEDMREGGFQMWNKKVSMNSYHIEAVLREYAKFHSVSLAMRANSPQRFEKLTKILTEVGKDREQKIEELTGVIKSIMEKAYKAVEGDLEAIKALEKYEKYLPDLLKDMKNRVSLEYSVVTHGDCWCNNFLFKYTDKNIEIPSDVCIVDWQISKLGLPTDDLAYFLFANGSKEVLDDYEKYIKLYYSVLWQNLKDFSCDPDEILPYQQLETLFRKSCKLYFSFVLLVMKIQLCDSDEAPDFVKDAESGKNLEDTVNFTLANMDEYYRRVALLVNFMLQNNMF